MRILASLLLVASVALAQNVQREGGLGAGVPRPVKLAPAPAGTVVLECGALGDGESDGVRQNVRVVIEGERIKEVGAAAAAPAGAQVIRLANQTCLPGLIDTHTHTFLQGDRIPGQYDAQLLKQSVAFRALEAAAAARASLDWGFTTIRDLETEGAGYADADLRDAIRQGIIPGPRMQVATRAMDVTGAYPLAPAYAWDVRVPIGVQTV